MRAIALLIKPPKILAGPLGIEFRVIGSHHHIAHLDDHIGTTDTPAMDGGDDGFADSCTDTRYALPHFFRRIFDVCTYGKGSIAGNMQNRHAVIALFRCCQAC